MSRPSAFPPTMVTTAVVPAPGFLTGIYMDIQLGIPAGQTATVELYAKIHFDADYVKFETISLTDVGYLGTYFAKLNVAWKITAISGGTVSGWVAGHD